MKGKLFAACGCLVVFFLACTAAGAYYRHNHFKQFDNYDMEKHDRYIAYKEAHEEMPDEEVLMFVNLNRDIEPYTHVKEAKDPSALDVFVSKFHSIPEDYVPELVAVDAFYAKSGITLRPEAAKAFEEMANEAKNSGAVLYIRSGYRSYGSQALGFQKGKNPYWHAKPGHSEHQLGLAVDLAKKGIEYKTLGEYKYHKTKEYKWLQDNAHRFGFILSYPKDMKDVTGFHYEPWHYRYVGVDIATRMKEEGIATYHEYCALYQAARVW